MGGFLFGAMALVALTLLALLRPWQDRRGEHSASQRELAAAVYRDQLAELDRDLAAGTLAAADHVTARDELQRRALDDIAAAEAAPAHAARVRHATLAIALALPFAAVGLYALLGQPAALLQAPVAAAAAPHTTQSADIERMVAILAARLEKNPDPKGWAILARSYHAMGRFAEASAAYAKIGDDLNKDPALLAAYADALASSAGGNLEGEPMRRVEAALRLDPDQPTALALAAMAAYKRGDRERAARDWQHLLHLLPPNSEEARWVTSALAEIGVTPAGATLARAPSDGAAQATTAAAPPAAGERAVEGTVALAPGLRASVRPEDTVFVFARPTDGSRMPLAVQRARVADLPLAFRLDDRAALSPDARISSAKEVRIEALVSRRGVANAAPGDLSGSTGPVVPGNNRVALTIDTVRP
jgi:cytochrome c-type biogenesis protein CcmH